MSILVDRDIIAAMDAGHIKIDPFDRAALGTNSYDVHLASTLRTYAHRLKQDVNGMYSRHLGTQELDCRVRPETDEREIPPEGFVLQPGELYLASTIEYTESLAHVPILNGKSSLGRLGLSIHVTAGTGDVGFCNHWTMELFVIRALRIYAGMPIGQLLWFTASDRPITSYRDKPGAKYTTRDDLPGVSEMASNFGKT
jgi:dCTP deaminase